MAEVKAILKSAGDVQTGQATGNAKVKSNETVSHN
jgi:hypothetical protein